MSGCIIKKVIGGVVLVACIIFGQLSMAEEVGKGKIPQEQLVPNFKQLPWECTIWDVDESIAALKSDAKYLWVDTRPESFFKAGTVRDAVLLPYNKNGKPDNVLSAETLAAAVQANGMDQDTAKIIMFCQGPECHRSYNATFVAVSDWGYKPENIIWFRAGYPLLLQAIKEDPKLKRKAKKYLSDEGVKTL